MESGEDLVSSEALSRMRAAPFNRVLAILLTSEMFSAANSSKNLTAFSIRWRDISCNANKKLSFSQVSIIFNGMFNFGRKDSSTHRLLHTMAPPVAARISVMRLLYIDYLMDVALGIGNCELEGYCLVITQANQCGEFRKPKWTISLN